MTPIPSPDQPPGASTGSTPQSTVTALGGVFSPDLDDYASGQVGAPACVLCAPGRCGCRGAW